MQINGFQVRFVKEPNLFNIEELRRMPWNVDDILLLNVDKMGMFAGFGEEEDYTELKVSNGLNWS